MARFYLNFDQGSAQWYQARMGVPTASQFDCIITPKTMKPSESRWKYACRLIAERLMNWQADSLDHLTHIAAGRENEPAAAQQFAFIANADPKMCGFVTTDDGRFGASPDRVIGLQGHDVGGIMTGSVAQTVEIKAPSVPKQMEYLLLGHGADYRPQVQGQLMVAEADKAVFYSYHPRMPPYLIETGRDDAFIIALADALERFHDELSELHRKALACGPFQAFAELVPPLDAARSEDPGDLDSILRGEF